MLTQTNAPRFALGALGLMVAAFAITYLLGFDFSVAIVIAIAAAGFLTIVAVMMIGAAHGESPMSASDSDAVTRWNERVSSRMEAKPSETNAESEA